MAHQLVLVLIPNLSTSVVDQVWDLLVPHCGDPVGDEMRFAYAKIGGRWDRIFAGRADAKINEADHLGGKVRDNFCLVRDLPADLAPGCVVTPDGKLHFLGWRFCPDAICTPDGEMACPTEPLGDEMDGGQATLWAAIRQAYRDCYAVAVDGKS